jgi:hypothetical protein
LELAEPLYYCNPVAKTVDGVVYPIIDPVTHLACYHGLTGEYMYLPFVTGDQFGNWNTYAVLGDCLCVPSERQDNVATTESTWGRIKALYR